MRLCAFIETLAMAYVDDELAPEERRELELHLIECSACRARLDAERADRELVCTALVAPRAPEMLRARVLRALDTEDRETRPRRRTGWLLPSASMVAAAAALAVFVGVRAPADQASAVVREAPRTAALDVQNAIAPSVAHGPRAPLYEAPRLVNRQATRFAGRNAEMLAYVVDGSLVTVRLVADIERDELVDALGYAPGTVTFFDGGRHAGYTFYAPTLGDDELQDAVMRWNMIERAARDR
jgi:anti-sigma factor RsiW